MDFRIAILKGVIFYVDNNENPSYYLHTIILVDHSMNEHIFKP